MATDMVEIRGRFEREMTVQAVPLDQRVPGFCLACGSRAEKDPDTLSWWHLDPTQCRDPGSAFVAAQDYTPEMTARYKVKQAEEQLRLAQANVAGIYEAFQEQTENLKFLSEYRAQRIARNLKFAYWGIIVAALGLVIQIVAQILRATGHG